MCSQRFISSVVLVKPEGGLVTTAMVYAEGKWTVQCVKENKNLLGL